MSKAAPPLCSRATGKCSRHEKDPQEEEAGLACQASHNGGGIPPFLVVSVMRTYADPAGTQVYTFLDGRSFAIGCVNQ